MTKYYRFTNLSINIESKVNLTTYSRTPMLGIRVVAVVIKTLSHQKERLNVIVWLQFMKKITLYGISLKSDVMR